MKNTYFKTFVIAVMGLISSSLVADRFHYRNSIVGTRAIGLGGAFSAISDDASAVYYNPAGLAYSEQSSVSASANTYIRHVNEWKDIFGSLGNFNSKETGETFFPSFVGGNQQIGIFNLAFAIGNPVMNVLDYNFLFTEKKDQSSVQVNYQQIEKHSYTFYAVGLGTHTMNNLALGLSLSFFDRKLDSIANQVSRYSQVDSNLNQKDGVNVLLIKRKVSNNGIIPKLGVMFWPVSWWSTSLTLTKGVSLHTKTTALQTVERIASGVISKESSTGKIDMTVGEHLPWQVNLGSAWFISSRWLISVEGDYYSESTSKYLASGDYNAKSVVNGAIGVEYYAWSGIALRGGFHTDQANTDKLTENSSVIAPHVDLQALTTAISWEQYNTALTLSGVYKWGSGQSSKYIINNKNVLSSTDMSSQMVTLSASTSF